jgi:hypothetical protein
MENTQPNNILEINTLIESFIQDHQSGIATLHRIYFKNDNTLSLRALIAEVMDELRTGCITFFNKEYDIEELNSYLFYIVNAFCKKRASYAVKKINDYVCPGCLYFGKTTVVSFVNQNFKCEECSEELKSATDIKKITLFRIFSRHNKRGYHCQECDRFIPHPLDEFATIACPYLDCCFVGSWVNLRRMHHPSVQINRENLILDATKDNSSTMHDIIADKSVSIQIQLELEEDLQKRILSLKEIIDYQRNSVPYSSSEFTVKHKILIYNAFDNLLNKYPIEMVNYLFNKNNGYSGFQAKVFQEYIRLLEESLPFSFKKNKQIYTVNSLLDDNLNIFDGISNFTGLVSDKGIIKNSTTEFYIGGRKSAITKPFYIGKLLNVSNKNTKEILLNKVSEYTFSLIKISDIVPGTEVIVTHLRVPPHYQMGGMSYINRIRKKIVERAKTI